MKKRFLQALPFAAALFLCIHFLSSFFYTAPSQLVPQRMQHPAQRYCHPVFEQYWSLFAPAPKTNKKLFYRVNDGPWIAPMDTLLRKNKASYAGRKIILYSNILHYVVFDNEAELMSGKDYFSGKKASGFNALRHLLKNETGDDRSRIDIAIYCETYGEAFGKSMNHSIIIYKNILLSDK